MGNGRPMGKMSVGIAAQLNAARDTKPGVCFSKW